MRKYSLKKKGFTIIELLVVILIIGLLTAAATASYLTAQRKSRDSARKTQVNNIAGAVETYYAANKKYPGLIDDRDSDSEVPFSAGGAYYNCQSVDSQRSYPVNSKTVRPFVYYYSPKQASSPCNTKQKYTNNSSGVTLYDPADYSPYPLWIPGLGPYLSPIPLEKNFYGDNTEFVDPLTGGDSRTYVYRHLVGGYAVYTKLETTVADSDSYHADQPISDSPNILATCNTSDPNDPCLKLTGMAVGNKVYNVYMVRK